MQKIVFTIQTGYHPDRMPPVLQNIADTVNHPEALEVVIMTHTDDPASHYFNHPQLNIKTMIFPDSYRSGNKVAYILENTTGKILAGMGDDFVIHTKGWDDSYREIFSQYPDEIVLIGVNDLMFKDSLITIPVVSRRSISIIGYDWFMPSLYEYYRVDDHVHHTYDILLRLGHDRIVYREDIVFEHNHYTMVGGRRIYTKALEATSTNDGVFYYFLEGQRKMDALKLAMAIDPSRAGEYAEMLLKINDNQFNFRRVD
jgi:hypothetical protein